ncbi:serine/threonine protein kinase [Enterobacter sp. RIT637]|uniref:serine/threonine-protein kinase n=1 Tax=Enterobacter sp. RIT637 TaxID=2870470 RepID=UPI001C88B4C6|nr:serine/threonine-protein kinase [Enterobacter sp. RIT637]MBX8460232.1 serine/threonine protein kinase [Enterobacter sp. RIT637]
MFRVNDYVSIDGKEYVVSKFLGQGGMGNVFLIEDKENGSRFALKTLQYYIPDDNNHRSLINEWEKARRISHKNTIHYYGFHDGLSEPNTPYLLMEYANSGSLENFLKSQTSFLDEDTCLNIFHQIIDGMEAVNEVLIHRDIKPDNIFIDDGVFKIADFGLAKIAEEKTRSKTFKGWGTEPYIAPEAYRAETNTIQMDMYSIGHVFYQIAALKHAFGEQNNWEYAHLTFVPPLLNEINKTISPKVAFVINKLMSKKPSARYTSWDCVRKDLTDSAKNTGNHKAAINNVLKNKISRDQERDKELSKQQIQSQEQQRKNKILRFQFNNEIISPITDFINDFNNVSGSNAEMKISEVTRGTDVAYKIFFETKFVDIWFHPLTESDVLKRYANDIWGHNRLHITKPTMMGKSVLAWGGVECSDKTGVNIVLVHSESDEYGDWYLLKNTHSGFSRNSDDRTEPFAFDNDELVTEIHHIGVMHIYQLETKALEAKDIVGFISNYL